MQKKIGKRPKTFSEYFKLGKPQDELEFLDIPAFQDIPLFLDPYGLSAMGTKWGKECESQIATYFQFFVDSIKNKDQKSIHQLLNALHEVNEISLGYSQGRPTGRGIGRLQAKEIQQAFQTSEAAKSGDIKDLADCALLIPGINRDKISDITANILKTELIKFTQKQCTLHNIPMKQVAINIAFDHRELKFRSYYSQLPVIEGKAKILLPLTSVRQDPQLNKETFYRNFVLEYLKAEHSHAGDALSSVLKNGKILVRISDLKKKYPLNTDLLYKFSKEHPQILDKYKSELRRSAAKKTRPQLKQKNKSLTAEERIRFLTQIPPGNKAASDFHKLIYDTLIQIFEQRLSSPKSEQNINNGRKRIDIIFHNANKPGFFKDLNTLHRVKCPKIIVECKNYGNEIGNPELDQLQGRLNAKRGLFGILVCRSISDKKILISRCRDIVNDEKGYIIVLTDADIFKLIFLREKEQEVEIDAFLQEKMDELIL